MLGSQSAARNLIAALGAENENTRMTAGFFLEWGGPKAIPPLIEAIEEEPPRPELLTILGDIGLPQHEERIRAHLKSPNPKVAESARGALAVLHARHS